MKKIILVLLFFVMPEYTFAANYGHTGTISRIVSVPAGADRDYILVDGFQSAGSCPVTSGLVIAKFPSGEAGNRSYALAMAAKMAGKSIYLVVDDTSKNFEGMCYVVSIQVTD